MRTLGFRTHVLIALAAAAGLVATLGRPWYALAPPPHDESAGMGDLRGPFNAFFEGVQRWITDPGGTTGWAALDHAGIALVAMAGIAALGGLICLVFSAPALGRDLFRYGALAAAAVVVWKLIDSPGPNEAMELRNGALAAAGCAAVLVTCALSVSSAPVRRKTAPPRKYTTPPPPPPPPVWETN